MPSEIREKPPPTPHPDRPRKPESAREAGQQGREAPEKTQDFDPDDLPYDSIVAALNLQLSQALSEPDPALSSQDTSGAQNRALATDAAILSFLEANKDQPGTAEVFEGVGSRTEEIMQPRVGWGVRMFAHLAGALAPARSKASRAAEDDDNDSDAHGIWMTLLLLSYASAVTLGLIWILWTGRAFRSASPTETKATRTADDQAAKSPEPTLPEELPPIPVENLASVGKTVRIGDVEVTPLSVQLAPVDLIGTIDPAEFRHEEANSLVLRFKLTNLSNVHTLKPLARSLVRDHIAALDRSFVATPNRGQIGLYPLAVESEWLILGQEFPVLKPGESAETLVASEVVTEDRLHEEMTWRIRLRVGPYRTDMLGVRFSKSELSP